MSHNFNQYPSQPKIAEYVQRIKDGESEESILQGLPERMAEAVRQGIAGSEKKSDVPVVSAIPPQYRGMPAELLEEMWVPPVYADPELNKEIQEKRKRAIDSLRKAESEYPGELEERKKIDNEKLVSLRTELGIEGENKNVEYENDSDAMKEIEIFMESKIKNAQSAGARMAYERLLDEYKKDEHRGQRIGEVLAKKYYDDMRMVDYPLDSTYEEVWNKVSADASLPNKLQGTWLYRGVFKSSGEKTETRGSMNVNISEQFIKEIDDLIKGGVIRANYKFGQPGTSAAADARHDAVSIYFVEQPSVEGLKALAEVAKRHCRGDNLLGKEIGPGFSLSEVGSIVDKEVVRFLSELEQKNKDLAMSLRRYLTSNPAQGNRIAMSEAQYYAVKKVLSLYKIDLDVDRTTGELLIK